MTNIQNINLDLDRFCKDTSDFIESKLSSPIKINLIKISHGNKKDSPDCCKHGSFIYYLYNISGEIIYIGETEVSVKSRLFGDGTGAHFNKWWFKYVDSVKYYKDINMDHNKRKLIERALIYHYTPKYNYT